ncbi:MAG: DUF4139 domain-containing protein, partial [Deltaproteobacteria bacterium]|nr:DUF4139 domain-containing protein [Deltaproteobacteria bacterium]
AARPTGALTEYDDDEELDDALTFDAPSAAAPSAPPPAPMSELSPDFLEEEEAPSEVIGSAMAKKKRRSAPRSVAANEYAKGRARHRAPAEAQAPRAEPELQASDKALDFGRLRLQGPDTGPQRGQLKAQSIPELLVAEGMERLPRGEGLQITSPDGAVALEESAAHFAARFEMEGTAQVAADRRLHSLTLLRREGKVDRYYCCVPQRDDHVYEVVHFANPLKLPLLAGPVSVYKGGDFVVDAPLATTPPGKDLGVTLGVEPAIKVSRNTHFKESPSGLFGGQTVLWHQVLIEIRSSLDHPARLLVHERLPVSRDDEVEVEVLKLPENAEVYDQRARGSVIDGGRQFDFEIDPGETKQATIEYQISIPSKRMLEGGNRRD